MAFLNIDKYLGSEGDFSTNKGQGKSVKMKTNK